MAQPFNWDRVLPAQEDEIRSSPPLELLLDPRSGEGVEQPAAQAFEAVGVGRQRVLDVIGQYPAHGGIRERRKAGSPRPV